MFNIDSCFALLLTLTKIINEKIEKKQEINVKESSFKKDSDDCRLLMMTCGDENKYN